MKTFHFFIVGVVVVVNCCIIQDCATDYKWEKRGQNFNSATSILTNLQDEYKQCLQGIMLNQDICRLLDSRICCAFRRNGVMCDYNISLVSPQLVCSPVKHKLASILNQIVLDANSIKDDANCCINAGSCCGKDNCKAEITCSIAHKKPTDDTSKPYKVPSFLWKLIKMKMTNENKSER